MAKRDVVRVRLLHGAIEALGRLGARRFSMTAVSEHAVVSRATLYRYFPTKDLLLAEVTDFVARDFTEFLEARLDASAGVEHLVSTAAHAVREYVEKTPALTRLLEAEPLWIRRYYHAHFQDLVASIAAHLEGAFVGEPAAVRRSRATTVAELLVRVNVSYRVIDPDAGPVVAPPFSERFAALLDRDAATPQAQRPDRPGAAGSID